MSKVYKVAGGRSITAVDEISLSVPAGQVFGLLGPNGAGKTTTIKLLCGLVTPTAGTIRLNGFDVARQRSHAVLELGAVLEGGRNVYWSLSAWQNLLYFGRLKGVSSRDIKPRAERLLRDLGLWDVRHSSVGGFSRGMQQKVAIAAALITDPPILLLDEPTIGLDVEAARTVKHWVVRLAHEEGKTIVLTTHQLDMAQQLCDRVAIMRAGRIVADMPVSDLLGRFRRDRYQIVLDTPADLSGIPLPADVSVSHDDSATILTASSVPKMLGNETAKSLLVLWANRATLVPELAVLVVFFLFVQFVVGDGRLVPAVYAQTLLGFASYALAYIVTLKMVAGTLEELNAGTLEQMHLSPLPAWALSLGRLIGASVEAVGLTALVSGAMIVALGVRFTYQLDAVVPIALTVLDVGGFGLLLGGLALRVPSIGAILHVMQGIVLFLNGSFVQVNLFPNWLAFVARLLPTTLGVEVTRSVLLQGASLGTTWSDHSLPWLLVHSAAMLVLGGAVYQSSVRRALCDGRLGPR